MFLCRVKGCRFKNTHTTRGHLCSTCKDYGHGRIECGKQHNLYPYYNDILPIPKQCTIEGCRFKIYHTNEAHHCPKCLQNHSITNCPKVKFTVNIQPKLKIKCPICRIENDVDISSKLEEKNEHCCVCLDKKASVIFPKCNHICCCLSCSKKLSKSEDLKIYNLYNQVLSEQQMTTYCDLEDIKKK